ncbi:chymotrypsin BI-like [Neocloeon triangulifer]|uniref:chymotrypsin BI-like n=1 Tax=Neocloeon triangulifer TaxID=2078957 RepID=UPI00286F1386|nr:chymotrypsin BI-like [Neocloeon triangulifer]
MFLALYLLLLCDESQLAFGGPIKGGPVWMKIDTNISSTTVSINKQIVGGAQANQGDVPWHALIVPDATNLCGASLISNQWIMTAGHCVYWHPQFSVYLGRTDRLNTQPGSVMLTVKTKVVNPKYTGTQDWADLALLKFDAPLDITKYPYIKPIRLVKKSLSTSAFVGTKVYVSGFGKTSDDPAPSNKLMWTNNTVVSSTVCKQTFGSLIRTEIICMSGTGPRSICHGDSGGAMVYQEADGIFTQIGTVAFVYSSCIQGKPQGFVRTGFYLSWISSTTGIPMRP